MTPELFSIKETMLASKGKRLGNFLIDYVIQLALISGFMILIIVISEMTSSYGLYNLILGNDDFFTNYFIAAFILILYYIIIESLTKKSIGKLITQTKIVMADGSSPKFYDILIRTLCRLIPFEVFSFLGESGKGWHDQLSKTYVVDTKKFEEELKSYNNIEEIGRVP